MTSAERVEIRRVGLIIFQMSFDSFQLSFKEESQGGALVNDNCYVANVDSSMITPQYPFKVTTS
ncbi:MAG: hypothetical protein DMF69_10970 [Acidobacteria bacterium]|nr:MAG: hypothetical protein DMF69_10970 [Acidobacteriota bacterium]